MQERPTKAILVVSFGTSHTAARKACIETIEEELAKAFPNWLIYRAWTSGMIIRKLKQRDHMTIPTVKEAMEQLIADGVQEVVVQPTHIINGIENDIMKEEILAFREQLSSISFGNPLLTTQEDCFSVIDAIAEELSPSSPDTALVLMGHGTSHYINPVYAALDYTCKDMGHPNFFIGTVEAYPSIENILKQLKDFQPKNVLLAPLLIVAGDHARNDMAGEEPNSWACLLKKEGYEVEPVLKGLGEYPSIRRLFCAHAKEAMNGQDI